MDSLSFLTVITKPAFGNRVWRFAKYPCHWNDGRIKGGFAVGQAIFSFSTQSSQAYQAYQAYQAWQPIR